MPVNPALADLHEMLETKSFEIGRMKTCSKVAQRWLKRHALTPESCQQILNLYLGKLSHQVKTAKMHPKHAEELLNRLIVLTDFEIPPAIFAMKSAFRLLNENFGDQLLANNDECTTFLNSAIKENTNKVMSPIKICEYQSESIHFADGFRKRRRSA